MQNLKKINSSEYGALGGVEPESEIASDEEMKAISKNPSDDLPNQGRNQY